MCINLIAAGGQIDVDELVHLLKCPSTIAVGLFVKFLIVPAVSKSNKLEDQSHSSVHIWMV